jgi:glycosyltransferase involved in cell wall biosynthesis
MLSVIIATDESEQQLLPTLAALVGGSVAGVVSEVIVADAGSQDATAEIADAAGCRFLVARTQPGGRWRAAAASARATWLMFLPPGAVLDPTWVDDAKRFVEQTELRGQTQARAAVFRAARDDGTAGAALGEALARLVAALGLRRHPARGLLIARPLYEQLSGTSGDGDDPARDLLRRLGRRRVVVLRSGAMMAGE